MIHESIEHLLTVLRGKMQTFEAIDDGEAQMPVWNDMLACLQSWIDEETKELKEKAWKYDNLG